MNEYNNPRRQFLKHAAASSLAAVVPALSFPQTKSSVNQLRIGAIGIRGIGWSNWLAFSKLPGVSLVAVADVDTEVIDNRLKDWRKQSDSSPLIYKDYRKMLENPDIDAVLIGTPDHWHALQTWHALQAGKHVYVEKPLANTVSECLFLQKLEARFPKLKIQVGLQQRSGKHWQDAVAAVHSGVLGKIRWVKAWAYTNKPFLPKLENTSAPASVDYDLWLGPAPKVPFNANRFHQTFRWYWDYAGGLMTDWGVHMLDIVLWAMKNPTPKTISASGGQLAYPGDAMEIPDTLTAIYEFQDFTLTWEHTFGLFRGPYDRMHGVAFIGEKGTLVVDRSGWEIIPEYQEEKGRKIFKMEGLPLQKANGDDRLEHARNFVQAIQENEKLASTLPDAAWATIVAHMGNIAFRTGQRLQFDGNTMQFTNSKSGNQLLQHHYRAPWKLG
jgi:predicted dehydrogenase